MTTVITRQSLKNVKTWTIVQRILEFFRPKEEVRVVYTSPGYMKVEVLWGLFVYEHGGKHEFIVRGSEQFIATVVSELGKAAGALEIIDRKRIR